MHGGYSYNGAMKHVSNNNPNSEKKKITFFQIPKFLEISDVDKEHNIEGSGFKNIR